MHIVGGGSRNDYLNQMTANACGLSVRAGPVEAAVIGNVLVQAIASGRFSSLAEGRAHVARNVRIKRFTPHQTEACREAFRRYGVVEARYTEDEAGVFAPNITR